MGSEVGKNSSPVALGKISKKNDEAKRKFIAVAGKMRNFALYLNEYI